MLLTVSAVAMLSVAIARFKVSALGCSEFIGSGCLGSDRLSHAVLTNGSVTIALSTPRL